MSTTKDTTDNRWLERLLNVKEVCELLGVNRTYFSQKLIKETNFLEIARPVHLYDNAASKYQLKDVLTFIKSRKEQ